MEKTKRPFTDIPVLLQLYAYEYEGEEYWIDERKLSNPALYSLRHEGFKVEHLEGCCEIEETPKLSEQLALLGALIEVQLDKVSTAKEGYEISFEKAAMFTKQYNKGELFGTADRRPLSEKDIEGYIKACGDRPEDVFSIYREVQLRRQIWKIEEKTLSRLKCSERIALRTYETIRSLNANERKLFT